MSSIIIGELGESIPIQQNTSPKKTFDKYLSDFHLTQNDCVIFDSKGQLVFKFSPQMSSETDSKFYIYTKIFEKESLSIGGGIWFEPSINHNKRLCSYSFKKDGKIVIEMNCGI